MTEPVRIDLSNLNAVERDGFILLLETERVLAVVRGDSCTVPAEDADKVAELLDTGRRHPTPDLRQRAITKIGEIDQKIADLTAIRVALRAPEECR